MKRIVLAALAAVLALLGLTAPAGATHATYVYIPIYIPAGPVGPGGADPGNYTKIHRVAVISAIGNFQLQKSVPIFPDKTAKLAEADAWQLDERVKETLKKYLGSKFTFVDVPYDPAKIYDIRPTLWHAGELSSYLKTLPNKDIDAFIVVRPNTDGAARLQSKHMGQVVLWVDYRFEIIDAHTYKDIGTSSSRYQVREGAMPGLPGLVLADEFTLDDSMKLTPERIEKLHKLTLQLLDVTMVETIRSLQLGVTLPSTGDHSLLPPPPTGRSANVKTIAVVSAIGDRLKMHVPGGLLVKPIDATIPFADQNVDADVEAMTRDILAKAYTFKTVPVDRNVIANKWWAVNDGKVMVNVPPTEDVDAYLLIVKDPEMVLDGAGVWHDGNWTTDWTYVVCNYMAVLVDAKTGAPIVLKRGVMSAKHAHAALSRRVDNTLWPKTKLPNALVPGSAPTIRDALEELLKDSLPETFYRMGLDVGTPPPQNVPGAVAPQGPDQNPAAQGAEQTPPQKPEAK